MNDTTIQNQPEKGLVLSRLFFDAVAPVLETRIPDIMARAATGLVGEGSECFGQDDEFSRDHDWGPAFCLWLPREELKQVTTRIEEVLACLPQVFAGYPTRMAHERRIGRVGPLAIEDFYAGFLGLEHPPHSWQEWRHIPEYALAACTNGQVFRDGAGLFSRFRQALLDYYPEDIRRKKMAARCMIMAQAGQYNFPRSLQRGELPAALLAIARFAEAALSMTFLLNRRFMPFYKWATRLAAELPVLGRECAETIQTLARTSLAVEAQGMQAVMAVERFCALVAARLRRDNLADVPGDWLVDLALSVQMGIEEPELRLADVMKD